MRDLRVGKLYGKYLELDITNCISCREAFGDGNVHRILSESDPYRAEFYCPPNCANPIKVEGPIQNNNKMIITNQNNNKIILTILIIY